MTDSPKYLTITEAAKKLRVSRQRVAEWIDEKRIPFALIAGRRLIDASHCKKPKPLKPGPKNRNL